MMKTGDVRTGDLLTIDSVSWDPEGHILRFSIYVEVVGEGLVGLEGYVGNNLESIYLTKTPDRIRPGHLALAMQWLSMHEHWTCEFLHREWERQRLSPLFKED